MSQNRDMGVPRPELVHLLDCHVCGNFEVELLVVERLVGGELGDCNLEGVLVEGAGDVDFAGEVNLAVVLVVAVSDGSDDATSGVVDVLLIGLEGLAAVVDNAACLQDIAGWTRIRRRAAGDNREVIVRLDMDGVGLGFSLSFCFAPGRQRALAVCQGDEFNGIDALEQDGVEENAGAEVFKRVPGWRFYFVGANASLVLGWDDELEVVTVRHHVHGDRAEERNLQNDAQVARLAHQDVALERGVIGDFAGAAAAGAGGDGDGSVQGLDGGEVAVKPLDEIGYGGILYDCRRGHLAERYGSSYNSR